MRMRPILTFGLACTFLLGANSCDSGDGGGKKKKKQKPVAEDPVLDSGQDLLITEIVPHDEHALRDEDGDPSDWIELHNMGSEVVPLADFALTDDKKEPLKWTFPERSLEPGAFVIVFASGKGRTAADGELHSNFKLASDGEYLALVRVEDRQAVHTFAPIFPEVPKGKSYGYEFEEGSVALDRFLFFDTPTPGEPNGDTPAEPDSPSAT